MANVRVPSMLRPTVGGERSVAAEGSTLRELIHNVDRRHPGFAGQLLETDGAQRRFVNIYVNDEGRQLLELYGAALEFTPAGLGSNGSIRRAKGLVEAQPERFYMPYQYGNAANPGAHYA